MAVSSKAPVPQSHSLDERRDLTDAALGVLIAVGSVLMVGFAASRLWFSDANVGLLLSYLAVWLPLGGAVLVAGIRHGSLIGRLGFRFRPIDLLWGVSIGLLARVAASLFEIAGYGRMGGSGVVLGTPAYDVWWLFGALLAPVLIAPVIEEVFFRGLLLRAVAGATDAARPVALAVAVVVSGAVFALVHLIDADSGTVAVVVGLSTFVFGVGAASVAAATGRLGGAIVAHVTFNALAVVPVVLAAG